MWTLSNENCFTPSSGLVTVNDSKDALSVVKENKILTTVS